MKTTKLLVSFFGIVLVLTSFVAAHMGDYDMMGSFGSGAFVFMWIFWILILVALVLFIAWLIKQIQEPPRRKRK